MIFEDEQRTQRLQEQFLLLQLFDTAEKLLFKKGECDILVCLD
jgi:hypothetical protein